MSPTSDSVHVATGTGDEVATTTQTFVTGVCINETADASAGEVILRDGSVSGAIRARFQVAAGGHVVEPLPGVRFAGGVFIERTGTGSTEVIVYRA